MRLAAPTLIVWVALGCSSRVSLPEAPTAEAPLHARQRFYRRHRAANTMIWVGGGHTPQSTLIARYGPFRLADGTTVIDPRDLVAVVGEDNPVASSAARAARQQNLSDGVFWGGFALTGAGAGLGFAGLLGSASGELDRGALVWSGIGAALVGSILMFLGQGHLRSAVIQHREAAFDAYDLVLRRRLALCGAGDTPGACEPDGVGGPAPTSGSAAPAPWGTPPR